MFQGFQTAHLVSVYVSVSIPLRQAEAVGGYIRKVEDFLRESFDLVQIERIHAGVDAQAIGTEIVKYAKRPVRLDEAPFSSDNPIVRVAEPMNRDPEILHTRGHQ